MRIILSSFLLCFFSALHSQNTRLADNNSIGWYNYFGAFKLDKNFSIHTEYQLRRVNDYITDKQQGLLRLGVDYKVNPNVMFRVGYAWIETYPYGDYPLNGFGKDFTEHRAFQMVLLSNKVNIVELSHRLMLEQRWVGRYTSASLNTEDQFPLMHRFRYMFRAQMPLKGKSIDKNTPYLAVYDEVFIGFGTNVNENIFDQNRIGILLGYKLNDNFRIEGGFLNQTLQLGREVGGRNVFQTNNGLILNTIFNFDLSKNKK